MKRLHQSVSREKIQLAFRKGRNKEFCLAQFKFEVISTHPCRDRVIVV